MKLTKLLASSFGYKSFLQQKVASDGVGRSSYQPILEIQAEGFAFFVPYYQKSKHFDHFVTEVLEMLKLIYYNE